jgi:hypothetical protein
MSGHKRNLLDASLAALAATLVVGTASTSAQAQAGINPDGSMWVNTPTGSTWTNPAGSVKLDKEGHVIDVSPNCKDVTAVNVQQAKPVCWKLSNGKYEWFNVGYVLFTCFDTHMSVPNRITTYVQDTGQPCDPVQEAFDRGDAQTEWQETWPVTAVTFPPASGAGGGTSIPGGPGNQANGGGGAPPPSGPPTPAVDPTPTPVAIPVGPNGGPPSTGGSPSPMDSWPPGADWIRPGPNGGWIIHYPDGRMVEQASLMGTTDKPKTDADKPKTDTTNNGLKTNGGGDNGTSKTDVSHLRDAEVIKTNKHPKKAEVEKKVVKKTTGSTKDVQTPPEPAASSGPSPAAIGLIGVGVGMGIGMGHGMHGGGDGMVGRGMRDR